LGGISNIEQGILNEEVRFFTSLGCVQNDPASQELRRGRRGINPGSKWLIDRKKGREFNPHGPFILKSMLQGQQSLLGFKFLT
jgi:hypothetical protein